MEGLRQRGPLGWVEQWLPEMYLVLAGLIVGLLCFLTPPFFTPDEPHQSARAISLSHGVLRARMGEREYGAEIDENALGVMDGVDQIRMRWERGAGFFLDRRWGPLSGADEQAQMRAEASGPVGWPAGVCAFSEYGGVSTGVVCAGDARLAGR